jgi:hypothetical protein
LLRRQNQHRNTLVSKIQLLNQELAILKVILHLHTASLNQARNISIHGLNRQNPVPVHGKAQIVVPTLILQTTSNAIVHLLIIPITHVNILRLINKAGAIRLPQEPIHHRVIHHHQGLHHQAILHPPALPHRVIPHHQGQVVEVPVVQGHLVAVVVVQGHLVAEEKGKIF